MGFEIRITGSTPLESLSMLAAAANYCMYVLAVKDAANHILAGDKSAATPGPHSGIPAPTGANVSAPAPVPASGTAPAPRSGPAPGKTPPYNNAAPVASPRPASGAAPAPGYGPVPGTTPPYNGAAPAANGATQNPPPPNNGYGYPGNSQNQPPVSTPGGVPVNPTTGEVGANPANRSTTTTTSPSDQQSIPGMPPSTRPGPGSIPVSAAPAFNVAQIGAAGADLITRNPAKRNELNALLQQYGVQTISELKPEQMGSFAQALRGLGANL